MDSPSTDNYTLGKGIVYFDRIISGVYTGERDMGNAPAFTFNTAIEKLEHYSSRGGLRAKDKEIISQITPGVAFTLDEINLQNLSLLTLGSTTTVTQTAGVATAEAVTAYLGNRTALMNRMIGTHYVAHGAETVSNYAIGEIVTGGTSGATGIVVKTTTDVGLHLAVTSLPTNFASGETLTGGTTSTVATSTAAALWVPGVILVQDSTDTTTYVEGTDYEVSIAVKDDVIGRIKVLSTGTITASEVLHVTYGYTDYTYTEISAFAETQVEGRLRFVSDNPAGAQQELEFWRVSLTPTGDTAMIGDDWSTLGFTGEILKDETNHPDQPYFVIRM